jgi:hypothetical protein
MRPTQIFRKSEAAYDLVRYIGTITAGTILALILLHLFV